MFLPEPFSFSVHSFTPPPPPPPPLLLSEFGDFPHPTHLHFYEWGRTMDAVSENNLYMFWIFREDPVKWARSGHGPPFLLPPCPPSRPHETTFDQTFSPHIQKARNPLLWADRHINTMLPLSAASVRSGGESVTSPRRCDSFSEAVKKGSSIYPTCGLFFFCFFFQDREQCCSLWCGFISLQAAAENGCCLVMAAA